MKNGVCIKHPSKDIAEPFLFILCFLGLACWGTSEAAPNIQPIYSFNNPTGPAQPYAGLTLGPDGCLYGTTYSGGTIGNNSRNENGTAFKLKPDGTLVMQVNFAALNETGLKPRGGLILGSDGNLHGTTSSGGGGNGTVFCVTTNGGFRTTASFALGADCEGSLLQGPDGNFYGTTFAGGSSGVGTVFKVATNGTLTTLVNFAGTNGANPCSGLTLGMDGDFYGTSTRGGDSDSGTIFKVRTNGVLTTLFSFTAPVGSARINAHGAYPQAALALGPDGNFYGTTYQGGDAGLGTVFQLTPSGVFTSKASFAGTNGAYPTAALTLGSDKNFYGTTAGGGSSGYGTAFRLTINGTLTTLASFEDATGAKPCSGLTLGPDGNFYGTAVWGGSNDSGVVFQLKPNGTLSTVANFSGKNGDYPYAPLVLAADGNLYGTTQSGGSNNSGCVFRVTTEGALTTLFSFEGPGPTGANPGGDLVLGSDGAFYGTTSGGGTGNGTIFRMTTNGSLKTIFSFAGSSGGELPVGALTLGADDKFYGTTRNGGPEGFPYGGTVFRVASDGAFTTIARFYDASGPSGAFPMAGLTLGADGAFYGTASGGGDFWGNGAVFRVTTNGDLNAVFIFDGGTNGSSPEGPLTLGPDGSFYGTTSIAGSGGGGTVFKITNGQLSTIASFAGTNGATPQGQLVLGPDGDFYGTTYFGGSDNKGTVFKVGTTGTLVTVASFGGTNGANPKSKLTPGPDGELYGTTQYGSGNNGVIYRLNLPPSIVGQPTNQSLFLGGTTGFEVKATGTPPLAFQWFFNNSSIAGTAGNRLALGPVSTNHSGNYWVIVTNNWGSVTSSVANLTVISVPRLFHVARSANGVVTFFAASVPGSTNLLWSTTNISLPMPQWQVIATNTSANGLLQFQDFVTLECPVKFYRLSKP